MANASQHTYIIPTKRPELVGDMLPADWGNGYPNVWLLVSAGTQASLERFWPELEKVPARVRGVSAEPLLEPLELEFTRLEQGGQVFQPQWVIVSGESGTWRRPMDPAWAGEVRDWCQVRHVPFYFKGHVGDRHDHANGLLDGREWREYPPLGGKEG
jgi:protein gp37